MHSTDGDVVLLTRASLHRNFIGLPFASAMTGNLMMESELRTLDALARAPEGKEYTLQRLHDMDDIEKRALAERHIISRTLLQAGEFASVLLRRDKRLSIMINESDHVKIQSQLDGNALSEAARMAISIDEAIGERAQYAFDGELGFLTQSPAHVGTGMCLKVLMHLPSLSRSAAIRGLSQELARAGMVLSPLGAKEGAAEGDLFLLRNSITLGKTEQEIIAGVEAMAQEIVTRERSARELLLLSADMRLEDRVFRSLGVLRYARRLSEAEWRRRWSDVRLGVQAGFFRVSLDALDRLLYETRPAHLEKAAQRELSPVERDERRALLVRQALA